MLLFLWISLWKCQQLDYILPNGKMIDETERVSKEALNVTEILPQHLIGGTEKDSEENFSRKPKSQQKLEPSTPRVQV
jgi:hypothetical protein